MAAVVTAPPAVAVALRSGRWGAGDLCGWGALAAGAAVGRAGFSSLVGGWRAVGRSVGRWQGSGGAAAFVPARAAPGRAGSPAPRRAAAAHAGVAAAGGFAGAR